MHTHLMRMQKLLSHYLHVHGRIRGIVTSQAPEDAIAEVWRELLARHARTTCALDRELHTRHGLGMSEFQVLERLATGESGSSRIQELAAAVHLSQSALSRTVGRLEADGLVERSMCPDDRRGISACLTAAGRERYEAARPTHRQVLADSLGAEPAA
jgi:DNA-binding MarR family transcriptional regulator